MQAIAPHPHAKSSADSPVWRLGTGNLDEWLTTHMPSHLSAPSVPFLITRADPDLQVAESMPDEQPDEQTAADDTFINAKQLMNEATANIDQIQKDDAIPVRINSRSTKSSKKQCREQVQGLFHDQIMLMATDHPLWSQGRWTLILNPQHLDATWTRLAKSLESGELHAQPLVIALRARHLPPSESFGEQTHGGQKRKKSAASRFSNSRTTSSSSSSSRTDNEQSVAIDVFFRAVWSSEVARSVLQSVAEACGRMPIFCRASLYSLLGIRSGHPLGNRSTLYNSKAFASPAAANLWTSKHERDHDDADTAGTSAAAPFSAVADTTSVVEAPTHVPTEPSAHLPSEASIAETAATDPEIHAEAAAEERPPKKVRIDSQPTQMPNKPVEEPTAMAVEQAQHATQETASTQDELMLPVRPAAAPVTHKAVEPSADQNEKHDLGTARDEEPEPAAAHQHKPEPIVTEQELGAADIAGNAKPSDDATKEASEPAVDRHAKQEPSAEAVTPGVVSDQAIESTTQDEPKIQEESQTQDESMTQIEPTIARGQDPAGAEAQPEKSLQPDSLTVVPSSAAVEAAAAEESKPAESPKEPPAPQQETEAKASEAEQHPADSAAAAAQPEKDVKVSEAEQHLAESAAASTQKEDEAEPSEAKQNPAVSAVALAEQPSPESVTKAPDASVVVASIEAHIDTKEIVTATLELPDVASGDQKAVPSAKHDDTAETSTAEVEQGCAAAVAAADDAAVPKQAGEGEAAQEATTETAVKRDDAPAKAEESKVAGAEMALEDLIVEAAVAVEVALPAAEAGADKRDDGPAPA
ncbi:uncharacterized protein PAN0_017d5493 [Moesziomyces antarcticus]|uniref:Uncharacterized protein n=2 Tax=Pseudozyma antarctica TaxID=84753 RepID=A0A081CKS0_PSEA2|nr:uncharacterized protein PAN0_017d5493 [Moesziomyces antarcticus]GAK67266.1 hypothetical protein PAN0_017d5493 [Moesziomyces antarcticus]SPO48123.1 uncharacterized protein PSANT_05811 [Moesziomyces antarcticus]